MSTVASEELLYTRQFILGPSFVDEFVSWQRINVNESLYLTAHPDLSISQAIYQDKSIILLGFILDPDNPSATDSDIINELVQSLSVCDDLFEQTEKLGGRWILIIDNGQEIRLLNDAMGLRQVFYTDANYTKDIWCAFQTGS